MVKIERGKFEERSCPCGCGQSFKFLSGYLNYEASHRAAFRTCLLQCKTNGPHVWSQLKTGPWIESDARDCWTTLHTWVHKENLITRVEDPENSPFSNTHEINERLLTRQEVLDQAGGKEWASAIHDILTSEHDPISSFILELTSA